MLWDVPFDSPFLTKKRMSLLIVDVIPVGMSIDLRVIVLGRFYPRPVYKLKLLAKHVPTGGLHATVYILFIYQQ